MTALGVLYSTDSINKNLEELYCFRSTPQFTFKIWYHLPTAYNQIVYLFSSIRLDKVHHPKLMSQFQPKVSQVISL